MKQKKLLSLILALVLLLPNAAAAASWEDFTDVSGHWAASDLQKAVADGLLTGTGEHTLSPDAPISTAQMLAVLNRVLNASQTADTAALSAVPADAWYAQDVAKAAYLGLIPAGVTDYDAPLPRQDALSMLAKAFGLTPAGQSDAPLSAFSDAAKVKSANRPAVANLVSRGFVKGFGGALNANGSVTRAEFITLLYRIAGCFTDAASLADGTSSAVLQGDCALKDISAGRLCIDCSAKKLSLQNTTVDELTLRCDTLQSFTMDTSSKIGTLNVVLGGGSFTPPASGTIGTLRLFTFPPITAGAQFDKIETCSEGRSVSISGKHSAVTLAGSGNAVTLAKDADLSSLTVTGSGNTLDEAGGYGNVSVSAGAVSVSGSQNSVTLATTGGSAAALTLSGSGNRLSATLTAGFSALQVDGSGNRFEMPSHDSISNGSTGSVSLAGEQNTLLLWNDGTVPDCSVTGSACWMTLNTKGASAVKIGGKYNTVVKTRDGETAAVALGGESNLFYTYTGNHVGAISVTGKKDQLKLDGTADAITVDGEDASLSGEGKVGTLVLNALGSTVTLSADKTDDSGAKKAQAEKEAAEKAAKEAAEEAARQEAEKQQEQARVLALVTTGYKGNYTLSWAQSHDYTPMEKKIWVQAKGYSSKTDWLIWVNLSMQRVNIFHGTQGNWDLWHSCIVGTGASGTGTPVGVYSTTYKSAAGWTTSTYNVHPVVGFKTGTGYAFHSRLYYPNGKTMMDYSIGYPISHGCVRMYDEDVAYIYNNVPIGTTVVVY